MSIDIASAGDTMAQLIGSQPEKNRRPFTAVAVPAQQGRAQRHRPPGGRGRAGGRWKSRCACWGTRDRASAVARDLLHWWALSRTRRRG